MITFYLLLFSIMNFSTNSAIDNPYSSLFKPAEKTGSIFDFNLAEASGMVASIKNKGNFWVINDSGNEAKLYLINKKGSIVHYYWIDGIKNTDWEDLSMKVDNSGKSWILIGDIGDNYAVRKKINILEIEEPYISNSDDTLITNYKNYYFNYDDGPKDAETILVDPKSSKLFVITKREENVKVYEAPEKLNENDTMMLSFKAKLPFYNVTSGDISSDGNEILLKNYNAIFYWNRDLEDCVLSAMSKEHELIMYSPEPQGESICWDREGTGFYTLSEKSWSNEQVLYFYERNNK